MATTSRLPGVPNRTAITMRIRQWIALLILSTLVTSGCQSLLSLLHPTPTQLPTPIAARPETTANAFLRAWERADYEAMYGALAPLYKDIRDITGYPE